MQITIKGTETKLSKKQLRHAIHYMSALLMHQNLTKHIKLNVILKEDLIDSDDNKRLDGYIEWLDDNISPRCFKICLNSKRNKKKQLMTLGHELVHLKQYAKNELKDTIRGPTNIKWKKSYVDDSKIHYYDLPWEIEAYGKQEGLYYRYIDHVEKNKIRF